MQKNNIFTLKTDEWSYEDGYWNIVLRGGVWLESASLAPYELPGPRFVRESTDLDKEMRFKKNLIKKYFLIMEKNNFEKKSWLFFK